MKNQFSTLVIDATILCMQLVVSLSRECNVISFYETRVKYMILIYVRVCALLYTRVFLI